MDKRTARDALKVIFVIVWGFACVLPLLAESRVPVTYIPLGITLVAGLSYLIYCAFRGITVD